MAEGFREYAKEAEVRVALMVTEAEQAVLHAIAEGETEIKHVFDGSDSVGQAIAEAVTDLKNQVDEQLRGIGEALAAELTAIKEELSRVAVKVDSSPAPATTETSPTPAP